MKTGTRHETTGKSKRTSVLGVAVCAMLFALCRSVEAQQPKKVPTVGFLVLAPRSSISPRVEAFRQGLHDLGYVEGKTIVIEYRSADEKLDRLPELAAELVQLKVDVIVSGGDIVTRVVKEATSTIPIVMLYDNDSIGSGLIVSLARPGGNITGLSSLSAEISGNRLEILKETVPRLSRLAVLGTSTTPVNAAALRDTELAARVLGVKLQYL